jgi:TRAP-type mannitol/chloroaromatic compound transport system permease large subunit
MMEAAGVGMLAAVAGLIVATGLPAWVALLAVALAFSGIGVASGAFGSALLTAMPARVLGLLEQDLLQALPLYVLMGALLNHLPLARILFRAGDRALSATGAGAPLAGLSLGVLLAPMNGSVGASVAMLARTVAQPLAAHGIRPARGAAIVCVASTLGVVIPPSLVLILLGDAMMRAHTEAVNITHEAVRIINTQDVFVGALVPALLVLALCALVAWRANRGDGAAAVRTSAPTTGEWWTAAATALFIAALFMSVTLGLLYAVEAAAAGAVALFLFGLATRALTGALLRKVLRDTMAVTGALMALLVGATMFTLVVRAFGTDRWAAAGLAHLGAGVSGTLFVVLGILALCALVLDAFEMIFVVIPVLMPPLLTIVHDATWVAVLTLLILQTSFLMPPFGYAVLLVRHGARPALPMWPLARALLPYVLAQLVVLAVVLAQPAVVWQRNPAGVGQAASADNVSEDESRRMLERQLAPPPDDDAGKGGSE